MKCFQGLVSNMIPLTIKTTSAATLAANPFFLLNKSLVLHAELYRKSFPRGAETWGCCSVRFHCREQNKVSKVTSLYDPKGVCCGEHRVNLELGFLSGQVLAAVVFQTFTVLSNPGESQETKGWGNILIPSEVPPETKTPGYVCL